ncbi:MAG: DMT family transporter [Candidatus Hinthialibacter sp.]
MQTTRSSFHAPATISLAASILLWATIPLFLRSFIHELDGWTANGSRYGVAAAMWLLPLLFSMRRGNVPNRLFYYAVIPSLINIIAQTFWAWTVYYLEPGLVMFLSRLSLIFTILASFALFPDELALVRSPYFWGGMLLLLIGFIGLNVSRETFQSKESWKGILLIFGNAVFLGLYGVSVRYFMRGVKPWVSFPIICIYTAAGLLIIMLLFGTTSDLMLMKPHRLVVLVISALVGIAFAHVTFYYAIEHLGASISAGCQLSLPFITTIGSYFIYGETFSITQWLFGLGLLGGAGLLLLAQKHLGVSDSPVPAAEVPEIEEFSCATDREEAKESI